MTKLFYIELLFCVTLFFTINATKFYSREQWEAVPSTDNRPIAQPVPYVVIHHTYIPGACFTSEQCMKDMRSMQRYHMSLKWADIGYNFCIGSEGGIYEGRGWNVTGAHARAANKYSIGICLIGDFKTHLPPPIQLKAAKTLIQSGVDLGYLSPSYKLISHKQVTPTECPGEALFKEISTWPNFYAPGFDKTVLQKENTKSTPSKG